jgi:NADP-dependent 3-hydroxy acid dehydrogenase YdfG
MKEVNATTIAITTKVSRPATPRVLEKAGQLDILHANVGTYVGGDLVDADTGAIDRMLNLNVNVVMKNVHDPALTPLTHRPRGLKHRISDCTSCFKD